MDIEALSNAPFYVILAIIIFATIALVSKYLDVRKDQIAANLKAAETQAAAVKVAAEIDAATLKYREEEATRRDAQAAVLATALAAEQTRRSENDKVVAAINAKIFTEIGFMHTAQQKTTGALGTSEKRVSAKVEGAKDDIIAHIDTLKEFISKSFDVFIQDQAVFAERYEDAFEVFKQEAKAAAADSIAASEAA